MPNTKAFQTIPYAIVGESAESASSNFSKQRTLNLYPEAEDDGVTLAMLREFRGLKVLAAGGLGEFDRGTHTFNKVLYQVAGGALFTINSVGTRTSIGSIDGTQPVSIADNGSLMLIVTELSVYTYDGATLTTISLSPQVIGVDYLNNQFIYTRINGTIAISRVGLTAVGSFFTPESDPDVLVNAYIFNQYLYAFGDKTIEPQEPKFIGDDLVPFVRMNGQITEEVGLSNRDAITNTKKAIYFVSDRGEPNQMADFEPRRISSPAISEQWKDYTISDATVETAQFASLNFVIFTFPTDAKVWCYVEQYDFWLELEQDTAGGRWSGASISEAYGKTFVSDFNNGNVYELDEETFTNNGVTRAYERILAPLSGSKLGQPGTLFYLSAFRVEMETGIGNDAEPNPVLDVSYSTNGGETFASSSFVKDLGEAGDFLKVMETYSNKAFRNFAVKLRVTAPTKCRFFNSSLDVRAGSK